MIEVVEAIIEFLRSKMTIAEVGYDLQKIYPDNPRSDLKDTSYPRMHILSIAAAGNDGQLGHYTQVQDFTFQFNIYTRPKIKLTIDGGVYEGAKLTKKIMSDAIELLRKYQDDPILYGAGLYNYRLGNVYSNFPQDPTDTTEQVAFEGSWTRTVK